MMVWLALYNSCVYESSYETLSLHKTEGGAKRAIAQHRAKQKSPERWERWEVKPQVVQE